MKSSIGKGILIALAIIIPLGLIALSIFWGYKYFKRLSFEKPEFNFDIADALLAAAKGNNAKIPVEVILPIKNENQNPVSISDLKLELKHNDVLVAKNQEVQENYDKKIIEPAPKVIASGVDPEGFNKFSYKMELYSNVELINFLKVLDIFGGQPITIQYKVSGNLNGWIPFSKSGEYTYDPSTARKVSTVQ